MIFSPVSNEDLAKRYLEVAKRAKAKDFKVCKELITLTQQIVERFIFEYSSKE